MKRANWADFMAVALACLVLWLTGGCTRLAAARAALTGRAAANDAKVAEEKKALATGQVDALGAAKTAIAKEVPAGKTNTAAAVGLAMDLAKRSQALEGLPSPANRIDVEGVLAKDKTAVEALERRFAEEEKLVAEKEALAAQLKEREGQLLAMGQKYEAERNKHILRRIWEWTIGTLGIGGLIAACVFCPALLPILLPIAARLAAWVVSIFPKLAGFMGVVETKMVDAISKGLVNGKAAAAASGNQDALHTEMEKALDSTHKAILAARAPQGTVGVGGTAIA